MEEEQEMWDMTKQKGRQPRTMDPVREWRGCKALDGATEYDTEWRVMEYTEGGASSQGNLQARNTQAGGKGGGETQDRARGGRRPDTKRQPRRGRAALNPIRGRTPNPPLPARGFLARPSSPFASRFCALAWILFHVRRLSPLSSGAFSFPSSGVRVCVCVCVCRRRRRRRRLWMQLLAFSPSLLVCARGVELLRAIGFCYCIQLVVCWVVFSASSCCCRSRRCCFQLVVVGLKRFSPESQPLLVSCCLRGNIGLCTSHLAEEIFIHAGSRIVSSFEVEVEASFWQRGAGSLGAWKARQRGAERRSEMKKVRDRLYIGNIKDAAEVLTSAHPPVTHMLSLITPNMDPLEYKKPAAEEDSHAVVDVANLEVDKLERKIVPVRDIESQNLLDHLEECLAFIEKGRSSGSILVHCVAGVSRSAAVITAYLMRLDRCTVDEALASLQQVSSKVYPNYGFMQQLQLFEEMGYIVDRTNRSFKKFHLENLGEAFGRGEKIENSRYAADPGVSTNESEEDAGVSSSQASSAQYSCKKCKRVVACQENVIPHDPISGESSFRWRRRGVQRWGGEDDDPACTALFIEPMQWMNQVQDGVYEGKLQCLNCEARLGNFNWAGIQCSCGTRVTPAFQLHKCNMDSSLTVKVESSEEPMRYSFHSDFSNSTSTRHCGHLLV